MKSVSWKWNAFALMFLLVVFLWNFNFEITGFAVLSDSPIDSLDASFNSNSSYTWFPSRLGDVSYLSFNGYIEGDNALIYLEDNLLYNVFPQSNVSASLVEEGDGLELNFSYGDGDYDVNNDGVTFEDMIIDYSVSYSSDEEINESLLCTRYIVSSPSNESVCYGNGECCGFLNLENLSNSFNETFYLNYGKYGASSSNVIYAQLVYYDVDLSVPYSTIYNSEVYSLRGVFTDKVYFSTDSFVNLDSSTHYTLDLVVDGYLYLDNVSYKHGSMMGSMSSNEFANLAVWDSADLGSVIYVNSYSLFYANYTDLSFDPILGAKCNITFDDGHFTGNLGYATAIDLYIYYMNFSVPGNHSYNFSCSHSGYGVLNETGYVWISSAPASFTESSSSFNGVQESSLAFVDYDSDDDWDLVVAGDSGSLSSKFYSNDDGNFSLDSEYSMEEFKLGSMSFGDVDNDGDLDLVVMGDNGNQFSMVYVNNGSGYSVGQVLDGVVRSTSSFADYNNDGLLDVGIAGQNSSEIGFNSSLYRNDGNLVFDQSLANTYSSSLVFAELNNDEYLDIILSGITGSSDGTFIYLNDENGSFVNSQNLTGQRYTATGVADFDNDGDLDLVVSGSTSSSISTAKTYVYLNSDGNFSIWQTLNESTYGSIVVGDYNNDGTTDIVFTGRNATGNSIIAFYDNNGSNFTYAGSKGLDGVHYSSIAMIDYDADNDLDLAVSGLGSTFTTKLYDNGASAYINNTKPYAPVSFNVSYNGTKLNLWWGKGNDSITPVDGLYYNLRVGTTPYGNDVVSGKYGGSSNPTQGYLGNMQQRRSIGINVSLNQSYYWQVQTIDSGLKASSWSSIQEYTPNGCSVPSDADWVITTNCVKYNSTVVVAQDKHISIVGGSLNLIDSELFFNVSSNGGSVLNVSSGELIVNGSNISSVNDYAFLIIASNASNVSIVDSNISKAGYSNVTGLRGVEINGSITDFENNLFSSNYIGLTLYSVGLDIRDSVLNSTYVDVIAFDSNVTFLNVSHVNRSLFNSSLNVSYYLTINVTSANESYAQIANVTVSINGSNQGLTNTKGYEYLEILSFIDNGSIQNYSSVLVGLSKSLYDGKSVSLNLTSNSYLNVSLNTFTNPIWTEFYNNFTTNFSSVDDADLSNLSGAKIGKFEVALIEYNELVDVSGVNLDDAVELLNNSVYVDGSISGLDKSANVTLFNLSYSFVPVVMVDEVICSSCNIISYNGSAFEFNVTGFSTYSSASNSKVVVSTLNRVNQKLSYNQTVYFVTNYTNRTSGSVITGGVSNCSIDFGSGYIDMPYDSDNLVYNFSRNFSEIGFYDYNVSCVNEFGFENLTQNHTVVIKRPGAEFTLAQSLEGVDISSLGIFPDDEGGKIIISGHNTQRRTIIYTYNGTAFVEDNTSEIADMRSGSISIIDYDNDGDSDVHIIGNLVDAEGQDVVASKIYRND